MSVDLVIMKTRLLSLKLTTHCNFPADLMVCRQIKRFSMYHDGSQSCSDCDINDSEFEKSIDYKNHAVYVPTLFNNY